MRSQLWLIASILILSLCLFLSTWWITGIWLSTPACKIVYTQPRFSPTFAGNRLARSLKHTKSILYNINDCRGIFDRKVVDKARVFIVYTHISVYSRGHTRRAVWKLKRWAPDTFYPAVINSRFLASASIIGGLFLSIRKELGVMGVGDVMRRARLTCMAKVLRVGRECYPKMVLWDASGREETEREDVTRWIDKVNGDLRDMNMGVSG